MNEETTDFHVWLVEDMRRNDLFYSLDHNIQHLVIEAFYGGGKVARDRIIERLKEEYV